MSQISKDDAQKLVDNFREDHPNDIRSLWLNSEVISYIRQTEDLDGLRVYQAQTDAAVYTVVVSPTRPDGDLHIDTQYFDYCDPCPPECGGNSL